MRSTTVKLPVGHQITVWMEALKKKNSCLGKATLRGCSKAMDKIDLILMLLLENTRARVDSSAGGTKKDTKI